MPLQVEAIGRFSRGRLPPSWIFFKVASLILILDSSFCLANLTLNFVEMGQLVLMI
jgi:hypothetical protein